LSKLGLSGTAKIAIPAGATVGVVLKGVIVDLSTGGSITIAQNGVLALGVPTAGAANAGGIITKINDTSMVVVAGGHSSTTTVTANSVTPFNSKTDFEAVVAAIGSGVSIQGTVTGGNNANNTIDANDTFASDSSPTITVTHT
jgi:hypothetical protein